ncbi:lipoate--protein ligase family protein [Exiguobacterium himgiriensis]|uniref:lipoate--protein ligase family protein n=1 Tax=Exiguobacterium himgiriensis TaxID=384621 RepID=UPI001BE5A92B|nr:lipoate--protein ligase family protein [Exiguobacterium sp. s122]MCT4782012.1 lipoate--protein ligase family protein [Exiguobacterium himgiriensis]
MIHPLLRQPTYRVIDQSSLGPMFQAEQSFATDDTLCASTKVQGAVLRAWVHSNTVVLGIQDARLPHLKDGIRLLHERGYRPVVRNSGGLAVVLDEDVLNLSLILPENDGIQIDSGYEAMTSLIQHMFRDVTDVIVAGEIVGSYCPGSFDLSIDGKKFAGISQRRVRGGVAVQIYLSVRKSGSARAALIRDFYEAAIQGEATRHTYPAIIPETMASLEDLLGIPLTVEDVLQRAYDVLGGFSELRPGTLDIVEQDTLAAQLDRMWKRNEPIRDIEHQLLEE